MHMINLYPRLGRMAASPMRLCISTESMDVVPDLTPLSLKDRYMPHIITTALSWPVDIRVEGQLDLQNLCCVFLLRQERCQDRLQECGQTTYYRCIYLSYSVRLFNQRHIFLSIVTGKQLAKRLGQVALKVPALQQVVSVTHTTPVPGLSPLSCPNMLDELQGQI